MQNNVSKVLAPPFQFVVDLLEEVEELKHSGFNVWRKMFGFNVRV